MPDEPLPSHDAPLRPDESGSDPTEQLREYAKRLETLRQIDRAILAAQSPSDIAEATLDRMREFVPFIRASVVLFHWEREVSEILALYQKYGETHLESGFTFPIDHIPIPDALHDGKPEMVLNIHDVPSTPITERLKKDENIRSYVSYPLVVERELIGMVNFGADEPGVYVGQWRHIIREVADQLAIAIRQARLIEQVKSYSEELEQRVQERTEELESFTYSVSHDLRTPLRAVGGFARMLKERYAENLDDEGRRLVRVIYENTQKMGKLINGLLALARLGRRDMNRQSLDVEKLVREAFEEALQDEEDRKNSRADREIKFTVGDLPAAQADGTMLRRLLVNLLSNALKFTREEDPARIRVDAREGEDGRAVYMVCDNGVGFDEAYADKLFGVFERLHDEESFAGTGIGLAIAERVVQRHSGQIWADGDVDEGATFYFTLSE